MQIKTYKIPLISASNNIKTSPTIVGLIYALEYYVVGKIVIT